MEYSGAGGKLIQEKNHKQKISWHCPFKDLGIPRMIYSGEYLCWLRRDHFCNFEGFVLSFKE